MTTESAVKTMVSGDWYVKAGNEEAFVARWLEFLQWTKANAPGYLGARLLRDGEDPQHFVSIGEWTSHETRQAWRGLPDFPKYMGPCRALCDDMRGVNYDLAASV